MGKKYWGVGNQEKSSVVLDDKEEDEPPALAVERHIYEQIIGQKAPRLVRAGFYLGMFAGVPGEAYQALKESIFFPKI